MDNAKKRKALYRQHFKTPLGCEVLDDMLAFIFMYHGKYDQTDKMLDSEVYIRQQMGRELLQVMDVIPSMTGRCRPQGFTAKLFTELRSRKK
ncbi:hypothetical protein LCGC14_2413200 [marine sediment metagenome]|uniref:Uncharacterized protein n=1 Tax=marine sediment metagenome TaxID=412755 RepID=A0A0F9BRX5_9ZZZZ